MKNKHLGYGLLYIILLPMALLLGMAILFCLLIAFSNLALLLPLFLFACFVVYTIASFVFYLKAVRQQQLCKSSLRDLIRINAFIIIIPAFIMVFQGIVLATNPGMMAEMLAQVKAMQQPMPGISDTMLVKLMRRMYYFLVVYASAMIIHIFYTFSLLKKYRSFFAVKES